MTDGNRLLVAYATKCGSTQEIAEFVAGMFADSGWQVDILPGKKVKNLNSYDAVILGTAIRMFKPLPEATRFMKNNAVELRHKPFALFSVGIAMKGGDEESRKLTMKYLESLLEIRMPDYLAMFAGRIQYARLGPLFRFTFSRDKTGKMQEGDFRDWETIRRWADEIHQKFSSSR